MARRIHIPEGEDRPLQFLARLDDVEFKRLFEGLAQAKPTVQVGTFIRRVLRSVDREGDSGTSEALSTLLGIVSAMLGRGNSAQRTSRELAIGLKDAGMIDESEVSRFQTRMHDLLTLEKLALVSQAFSTFMNQENLFQSSSISTSLHPIFAENTEPSKLSGGVILNELQINSSSGLEDNPVSRFLVDVEDLHELRREIDRTLQRISLLQEFTASAELNLVEDASDLLE